MGVRSIAVFEATEHGGSLSDQVYEYLSEQIVRGIIRYGDRLNIKTIATQLRVSPMPIRDALKRLEFEQVVVIKPRSTCYVRVPTKSMTLHAIATRRMLELWAMREVYRTVGAADLAPMAQIIERMRAVIGTAAPDRPRAVIEDYIELDRLFHTEVCRLSGNVYLQRFYREINMQLNMSFRYGVGLCHGLESTFQDHCRIYEAMLVNSPRAVELLENHLRQSEANILNEPTFQILSD